MSNGGKFSDKSHRVDFFGIHFGNHFGCLVGNCFGNAFNSLVPAHKCVIFTIHTDENYNFSLLCPNIAYHISF